MSLSPQFREPKRILMVKAHSMGIGDILRSSAAWRALKNHYPDVELHLLFLSKHAGYPSEALIQNHHLLHSASFVTIREGNPNLAHAKRVSNRRIWKQVWEIAKRIQPDWVIDFEWAGTRTAIVTRVAAWAAGAQSLGIHQFPTRNWYYSHTAPSTREFVAKYGLTVPFDYTWRDFVVLDALGIARDSTAIELRADPRVVPSVAALLPERTQDGVLRIGLNIGCATPGAAHKRMAMEPLALYFKALQETQAIELVLTGAPDENAINESFIQALQHVDAVPAQIINLAGKTNMQSLPAAIDACDVFVSTDSGPYHMAVALHKPTLCWLTYREVTSWHDHPWVRCLVNPEKEEFLEGVRALIAQVPVRSPIRT